MAKGPIDSNAKQALNQLKLEIANELGINNLKKNYKGNVSSRENGYIGGEIGGRMTKKLIEEAEKQLINKKNDEFN